MTISSDPPTDFADEPTGQHEIRERLSSSPIVGLVDHENRLRAVEKCVTKVNTRLRGAQWLVGLLLAAATTGAAVMVRDSYVNGAKLDALVERVGRVDTRQQEIARDVRTVATKSAELARDVAAVQRQNDSTLGKLDREQREHVRDRRAHR